LFLAEINGEMCQKPYTPISPVNHRGEAQFVIKIYRDHPDFPNGGKFSQHIEKNVNIGDELMVKGPVGRLRYNGFGEFQLMRTKMENKKKIGLIAGGTGITPMYAIAQASSLAKDGSDITFLYSNKTKDDILIR
jgi:ferredoxin-NADP reductase